MGNRTTRVEFAERVQEVRHDAGLSVQELSVRSGIAYRTLRARLEGRPGRFSVDEFDAIADAVSSTDDEAEACFQFLMSGSRLAAQQAVAS